MPGSTDAPATPGLVLYQFDDHPSRREDVWTDDPSVQTVLTGIAVDGRPAGLLALFTGDPAGHLTGDAPAVFAGEPIFERGRAAVGGAVFAIAFDVPDSELEDFDAWYEHEHAEMLLECPGWWRVRRYAAVGASARWNRLAFHDLRDEQVWDEAEPQREAARQTPWRSRLAERPWFTASDRWIYRVDHLWQR